MFVFNNLFSFLSFRIEMIRFTDFLRLEMRLFCDELESHTSDGFQFYARFVFQRCADFLDEYIQTSGSKIVFVFHSPEPAQYGFAAHHLVLFTASSSRIFASRAVSIFCLPSCVSFRVAWSASRMYLPSFIWLLAFSLRAPAFSWSRLCI